MKKVFQDQLFRRFFDHASGRVFEDTEFRRCRFESCAISSTDNPLLRSTIRRVSIVQCDSSGFNSVGPAIVEETTVDGLKVNDVLQTWGMVFKHVILRGRIGPLMLSNCLCPTSTTTDAMQRAFEQANAEYYSTVDWALDISQAEFTEDCEIRGIPAKLIHRDPETQAVVTRERVMRGNWRLLGLEKTFWKVALEVFLESGDQNYVLIAPKRAKDFKHLLRGLQLLRDAGIAEPD